MKRLLSVLTAIVLTDTSIGIEYQYPPILHHIAKPRQVLNLCGEWDFRALSGQEKGPLPEWQNVQVPHSAFTEKNHSGIKKLQYRKTFSIPDSAAGQKVFLHFESVPETSETFLNGERIGIHHPGGTPFSYDLSSKIKKGSNELEVRISYCPDKNRNHRPYASVWSLWGALGISRPVHLEIHDPVYIADVTVRTVCEPEKELLAEILIKNETPHPRNLTFDLAVSGNWNATQAVNLAANSSTNVTFRRKWKEAELWTPSTPHLYFLDLTLREGNKTLDAYRQRFGFREIRIRNNQLLMNGHPFLVRRDSCPGYLPDYPSDAKIREIIQRYKSRGINGVRISPMRIARWAEIADEEGLMISSIPEQGTGAGRAADDFWPAMTEHLLEIVRNFKNHPSLICWGIGNEFGSVYNCNGKEATVIPKQQALGAAVEHADPTRPWTSYGDIEAGFPVRGPGPAKIRSFHYPMTPTASLTPLPELAYWYSKGKTSWQGISSKDKPLSISEDLYHGLNDQFFGISRWAGDSFFSPDGYAKAWFDAVRMYAEGYYDAGISGWEIWVAFPAEKFNKLYSHGQLIPDYLIALREVSPNLKAGTTETRNLSVYNQTFLEQDCELVRKDTANGKVIGEKTWKLKLLPGGKFKTTVELTAPETENVSSMESLYLLKSGGKILTRRVYRYNIFPEIKLNLPSNAVLLAGDSSPLRRTAAPEQCVRSAEEAAKSGKPVIVHKTLNSSEGKILNALVANGGKVLLMEAGEQSWTPSRLQPRNAQSFVWRRNDDALPGVSDSMLQCWKPDTFLGESGYMKNAEEAMEVLLDSGHRNGLNTVHLSRLYNGKGFWMLCQLPLLSRIKQEPAAPFLIERIFEEFQKDSRKTKHLTLWENDPLLPFLKNENIVLDSRLDRDSVLALDGTARLTEEQRTSLKKHAENGGSVLILGITENNAELLDELGLELHPAEECEWILRKNNRGLLAGISNNDLFFSSIKPSDVYFQADILNRKQRIHLKNKILTGRLKPAASSSAAILTDPGAIAEVPFGKGRIALTSLNWKKIAKSFPERAIYTLRTLLLNLGVNSAELKQDLTLVPYEMRWIINRQFWKDPKHPAVPAWFENGNDMRYFPVNLCGWSPDSNNFCPKEAFPEEAMNFGGIKFKLSDPKGKFTGALVLSPKETKTIWFWSRNIHGFYFLGAMEKSLKEGTPVLKCSYGYRYKEKTSSAKEATFYAGDHLNTYRWPGNVKSGRVAWSGPTQLDKTGVLYTWHMKSMYPPDAMISYMDLTNESSSPVAIVAITLEKKQ